MTSKTKRGFTGHEDEEEFGLINMKGRWLDPKLGRFTTTDPIIANAYNGQSFAAYSYVRNNPLTLVDPTGFVDQSAIEVPPEVDMIEKTIVSEYPDDFVLEPLPEEIRESTNSLRFTTDVGTTGDGAGGIGTPNDSSNGLGIMGDVIAGAGSAYGHDVLDNFKSIALFTLSPQAYFAWQGYRFWSGVYDGASTGYGQDGVFGAFAGAINAVNPFAHVGISLAATVDAAEKGDYSGAGQHGYQAAKGIAGIVAAAIGVGVGRGASPSGSVVLDTNALIASVEKGQATRILGGRAPLVPITVAKEFLQGGGSSVALRTFLTNNSGRIALAGSEASATALQKQAADMGRVLHRADARIVAGAAREGLPLVTNDVRLGKFLQAARLPVEGF